MPGLIQTPLDVQSPLSQLPAPGSLGALQQYGQGGGGGSNNQQLAPPIVPFFTDMSPEQTRAALRSVLSRDAGLGGQLDADEAMSPLGGGGSALAGMAGMAGLMGGDDDTGMLPQDILTQAAQVAYAATKYDGLIDTVLSLIRAVKRTNETTTGVESSFPPPRPLLPEKGAGEMSNSLPA